MAYASCVADAGGVPVLLPPIHERLAEHLTLCDGFVLTGGDDPRMEQFGEPTHERAAVMNPDRQRYETDLLHQLQSEHAATPVLGICLGMQLMSLVAGGKLDQHLPDSLPSHARHAGQDHAVVPLPGISDPLSMTAGTVASHHRQAIIDPGRLIVTARAEDGVIEAVADPSRRFCIGVQWHPERTTDESLGLGLFRRLVAASTPRPANA